MKDYTKNTHVKNYYENGRSEPRILVESPSQSDKNIEYSSTYVTSSIVEYEGNIPDGPEVELNIWHHSQTVQEPIKIVAGEYENIQSVSPTNTDDRSLEEAIADWVGDGFDPRSYKENKREFLSSTQDRREPYCTSLLTCSCGDRIVCDSVSEALGTKYSHDSEGCSLNTIWYFCGVITTDIRRTANSAYEASTVGVSNILNKIRGKDRPEPIYQVPIDDTPYSIALRDVGAYDITDHSGQKPVDYDE